MNPTFMFYVPAPDTGDPTHILFYTEFATMDQAADQYMIDKNLDQGRLSYGVEITPIEYCVAKKNFRT